MGNSRGAKIAKNTLYLYSRMLISMIITLYTSRIVLSGLGATDYGIYNVVSGFVVSFGFLNSAMHASIQRFLTVEAKDNNCERMNKIFSMGVSIHLLLAFAMILIAEPIGIYFIHNKLVIPDSRLVAAIWIFHFSIISLFFNIMNVPYRALMIAREDMWAFASISLIEVFAKLVIALAISCSSFDKLTLYGFLLMCIYIIVQCYYMFYCRSHYKESKYKIFWDQNLFKNMSCFAGWNLIGVFAGIIYNQGVNVVLNIFGGPIINAARAIAFQVSGAANQLVTNFQLAASPPIMKAYVSKDERLFYLLMSSCKLSYILMLFLGVPFIVECPTILGLWLGDVPEFTIIFSRLAIIDIIICSLAGPLHSLVQATGVIRNYQIIISGILLLNLPLSYLLLALEYNYDITFIVSILLSTTALAFRFIILRKFVYYKIRLIFFELLNPITIISIISLIIAIVIHNNFIEGIFRLIFICVSSWVIISILSWMIALNDNEKRLFMKIIKK